jgi:hypothetical protein
MTRCEYKAGLPPVTIAVWHAGGGQAYGMEWIIPREFLVYIANAWPVMPVLSEFNGVLTLERLLVNTAAIPIHRPVDGDIEQGARS